MRVIGDGAWIVVGAVITGVSTAPRWVVTMVTPSGVVGTVTTEAVEGAVVMTVDPATDVDGVGAVVVAGALDTVEEAVDVELGGVEVADTAVEVDVELVDAELEVLVDVELVVSVGDEAVVEVSVGDEVVVVAVDSDDVDVDVDEVVVLVVVVITGGESMIRGVAVTISGGTVATGSLASILTSACCTRLASSAFCWASPTSLTRAAATPSCCCAPSQSPWEISFST